MAQYKILGVNDDLNFCNCCGKQRLARVVWMENLNTGEVTHYGTTCAARLFAAGTGKKAIKKAVFEAADKVYNEACEFVHRYFQNANFYEQSKQIAIRLRYKKADQTFADLKTHNINLICKHH